MNKHSMEVLTSTLPLSLERSNIDMFRGEDEEFCSEVGPVRFCGGSQHGTPELASLSGMGPHTTNSASSLGFVHESPFCTLLNAMARNLSDAQPLPLVAEPLFQEYDAAAAPALSRNICGRYGWAALSPHHLTSSSRSA
ncbi:hypothetical protein, conserved [Leishmania tarentolae]|uniref:Uncharacterized protein n=1 Tax=Leishmania tarentolae TaxID=5689 RepID=A0A640KU35_LEITA|nr:hypothetical protein, conserved [Leishmania tarentolae]